MAGVWEEVHGLDGADVVVWGEVSEVAGEGGGVTADAEDLRNLRLDEGIQELGVAALSRWVDDGKVGTIAFTEPFRQPDFGLGGGEVGVFEAVGLGGFFGILDGLADAVNTGKGLSAFGDEAPDGADAAVEVQDARIRCHVNHVLAALIEDFRLGGVHLEEGGRRKVVVQTSQGFRDGFLAR